MLDDKTINVLFEISKRVRHIKILLIDRDSIKIKFNKNLSEKKINEVVLKHKKWILKNIFSLNIKLDLCKKVVFLGEVYSVIIDKMQKEIQELDRVNMLYVLNDEYSKEKQHEVLKKFYKQQAVKILPDIVQEISETTKLQAKKIGFRYAVSRWGSCSHNNNISLNYMMMQFNISFARYVILHEFCHILHKNHSKKFWDMVAKFMSDYQEISKQTKTSLIMNMDI